MEIRASRPVLIASALAVGGAALLVISLFLNWYGISVPKSVPNVGGQSISFKGWDAFEVADGLFLFILLVVAWFAALRVFADGDRGFGLPAVLAISIVFILMTSDTPELKFLFPSVATVSLKAGAWLGAVGAAMLAVGAVIDVGARPVGERTGLPPRRTAPPPPPPPPATEASLRERAAAERARRQRAGALRGSRRAREAESRRRRRGRRTSRPPRGRPRASSGAGCPRQDSNLRPAA